MKSTHTSKHIHKKHGKSYYLATQFFPKHIREATYTLYAFFRIPDDIVDIQVSTDEEAKKALTNWKHDWHAAYTSGVSSDPFFLDVRSVCHTYHIPYHYTTDFLDAMIQDTEKKRYASYKELEQYMYGSAAVVGCMMTHVVGYTNDQAFHYAQTLGYAMQMTNFLRDISDDYIQRGRIYLPQDELAQYGLSEEDIKEKRLSPQWKAFMTFQIQRCRDLYAEADKGIPLLHEQGRTAVTIARILYVAILDKIEEADYNIFSKRVKTSFIEKISYIIRWKYFQ